MNLKKHISFVIGGVIVLLLVVAAAVFLILSYGSSKKAQHKLDDSVRKYNNYQKAQPFPSGENVAQIDANTVVLNSKLADIMKLLEQGRFTGNSAMDVARFPGEVERVTSVLNKLAVDTNVEVPANFGYSFERYLKGDSPKPEYVSRLVKQLDMISRVSTLMFTNGISSVSKLERQVFDVGSIADMGADMPAGGAFGGMAGEMGGGFGGAPVASGRGSLPAEQKRSDDDLYIAESLRIDFLATEKQLLNLMNALSGSRDLFVVVSDVNFTAVEQKAGRGKSKTANRRSRRPRGGMMEGEGGFGGMPAAGAGGPNGPIKTKEERIVAGVGDLVSVILYLDVYSFRFGADEKQIAVGDDADDEEDLETEEAGSESTEEVVSEETAGTEDSAPADAVAEATAEKGE